MEFSGVLEMENEILTANELAARLKLKPETIRVWAREGRIPSIRPTQKILRFDLQKVLQAISSERRLK